MTWEELETACKQCRRCALCETRNTVVFGDGARDAEIMLIGEGPGEQEDRQGVPFVGPAGRLLDDMLELTGLDRTKVYIGNIVKCRPPRNRDPLNTEQAMCLPWLRRQTALLRPKLIVCLGRIAAKAVIKSDFGITREHGQWFERNGVQMTALYHPSALLRDPSKRPETFLDLLSLREKVRQVCVHTELSLPRTEPADGISSVDHPGEDGTDGAVHEKQENSQPERENKEQENHQAGPGRENKDQQNHQAGPERENKEQENNQPGQENKEQENSQPGQENKEQENNQPGQENKEQEKSQPGQENREQENSQPGQENKEQENNQPGWENKEQESNQPGEGG
ncbi:MAG: hypothetical protein IJT94_11660 [Oscillibacter sp.]|nr:hypothetical protein [Oscillibacter sp.]